jgi:hypothetical protein
VRRPPHGCRDWYAHMWGAIVLLAVGRCAASEANIWNHCSGLCTGLEHTGLRIAQELQWSLLTLKNELFLPYMLPVACASGLKRLLATCILVLFSVKHRNVSKMDDLQLSVHCVLTCLSGTTQGVDEVEMHADDNYGDCLHVLCDPDSCLDRELVWEHFGKREPWAGISFLLSSSSMVNRGAQKRLTHLRLYINSSHMLSYDAT